MSVKDSLRGVYAPITTPFLPNESVDYDGLGKNMQVYAQSGIAGYLALGSNGENKSLFGDEKLKVLEAIVKGKGKGQRVMAGCIAESTAETIYQAKAAAELGADFITLLPPCYFAKQMTDDVLYRYFTEVAEAVKVPCLVYCAPQFSAGIILSPALITRLAGHPNIAGIKDSSSGNIDGYLAAAPEHFAVLAGSANFFIHALENGATGGIISLANAFPDLAAKLYDAFVKGEKETLAQLNQKVLTLNKAVSGKGGVSAVKRAMDLAGLAGGAPRRPLLPLDQKTLAEMKDVLVSEGMI